MGCWWGKGPGSGIGIGSCNVFGGEFTRYFFEGMGKGIPVVKSAVL